MVRNICTNHCTNQKVKIEFSVTKYIHETITIINL